MLGLRMALRRLRRRPGRSLTTALTLSIGVGATTTAFAAVDGVLFRDLPVSRQDELIVAWQASERTTLRLPFSGMAFDILAQGAESLSTLAGYSAWGAAPVLVETPEESYALNGSYVAGDFFGVLGARPALGRLLAATDDALGAHPVVVLSYDVWRTRYGADPRLVGSSLVVADQAVTVVGVAPEGFDYPRGTQMWYTLRADYANPPVAGPAPELHLLGRMAPGVEPATVAADISETLVAYGRTSVFMADARNVVRGFEEEVIGSVDTVLYAAFCAALVLLLAAMANATLFLLSGGRSAAHEVAVRAALGAERAQLMYPLLADAAVIGALGCVGGVALAHLGLSTLLSLAPLELPRFDSVTIGGGATAFAVIASMFLAVTTGGIAGLVLTRFDVGAVLLSGDRGNVQGPSALQRAVAGVQVASAVLSAVGAGLLVRTVIALDSLDPGFSAHDMTAVSLQVPYSWFDVPEDYLVALEEVVRNLESRPGIIAARPTLGPPLQQRLEVTLRAEGQSEDEFRTNPAVAVDAVLPGHFRSLGIPLRTGRGLTEADNQPDASPVVVVDEVLARALWPGVDPIGKRIVGYPGLNQMAFTVVGVAAATRYRELFEAHPRAYYPLRLLGNSPPSTLLVRTVEGISVPVRDLVADAFAIADPQVRILAAYRMTEVLREPTVTRRFAAMVLVLFASATLLLALLGIYSVFTIIVQARTREMGVRRALGAQRIGIIRMVLSAILVVAGAGAAMGAIAALWTGRLLGSLLYGVEPTDAGTLAVVVAGSLLLALLAGLAPAIRASMVNPAISLRSD